MSYEHKPYNPNKGGITRSGHTTFQSRNDRHPSDHRLNWADWLVITAIFVGLLTLVFGVTVWAGEPFGGAR